jgi:hypothetical protein
VSGRWVEFERTWHDTGIVNCSVCGRLIPRRAWTFETGHGDVRACSKSCEELYFSYLEPTYGPLTEAGR